LLAAAARTALTTEEMRALHAELADRVEDDVQQARHRALAADSPDEAVAEAAERAAESAAARAEHSTAASLLQLAVSVTPSEALASARRRRFQLARELGGLGEEKEASALLEQLASELPAGGQRSDVLVELAWIREDDMTAEFALAEQALAEADSDSRRANAHS